MDVVLLALILLGALLLIPLGLPGTWIMFAAAIGHSLLIPGRITLFTIIGTGVLALTGEIIEFVLSMRYTRRYGGSRRAEWGAVAGGILGAFMGIPVPIIGPVIGAFLGAFLGAMAFELSGGTGGGAATRVAFGALVGRAIGAAVKVAIGMLMAVWVVLAALS